MGCSMNLDLDNIDDVMYDSIERKDESLMKEVLLKAMALFLESEDYTQENLDNTASLYLLVPIQLGWKGELILADRKLHYVLEELSAIEDKSPKRAKDIVRRCKLYLEDKDYEK
jgi:hypothetical protein